MRASKTSPLRSAVLFSAAHLFDSIFVAIELNLSSHPALEYRFRQAISLGRMLPSNEMYMAQHMDEIDAACEFAKQKMLM